VSSPDGGSSSPILVTGAPRSGTTWVGRMLTLAPGVGYIHEPFNPTTDAGISGRPVVRFFEYVTPETEARYAPHLERSLRFSYDLRRQLPNIRSARGAGRTATDLVAFTRLRLARARPLVKDPIAVFSAGWLADRFGMDVIVTIRHPAAFVASFTRLGYRHDFDSFLAEPQLLVDYLGPFEGEIRRYAEEPGDPIDEAVLLWRLVYATVDRYRTERPDWSFVRHEDLSLDPLGGYAALYSRLGLEYTDDVQEAIRAHTSAENPDRLEEKHAVKLDSRAGLSGWRKALSEEQVGRIREGAGDVWPAFYDDADW
jgi:Sulfotransferase family